MSTDPKEKSQSPGQHAGSSAAHTAARHSARQRELDAASRRFEDLTLGELTAQLMRSPRLTWKRLQVAAKLPEMSGHASLPRPLRSMQSDTGAPGWTRTFSLRNIFALLQKRNNVRLILFSLAIIFAWIGSAIARGTDSIPRYGEHSLQLGAQYLWLAFLLWLAGEIVGHWPRILANWHACSRLERRRWLARIVPLLAFLSGLYRLALAMAAQKAEALNLLQSALGQLALSLALFALIEFLFRLAQSRIRPAPSSAAWLSSRPELQEWIVERRAMRRPFWADVTRLRWLIVMSAAACSTIVWTRTSGNRIEWNTILVWLLSIALWGFAFAPLRWNIFDWAASRIDDWRRFAWRSHRWVIVAFALIMSLGFVLRFTNLESSPPQLNSDHVENIKDAYNMRYNNYNPIMFTFYSSREPLHYYLLVALSHFPGIEINKYAFSLLSAIEGLVSLALLFWLGKEVTQDRGGKFGAAFALIATALAAVSFWHLQMSRQGFRIALCPLLITGSFIFYARALRHNRRTDFVKSGIILGFGLISYQAVQMLPVVYAAGLAIALVLRRYSLRKRLSYTINFAILAAVAFVVFLPLFHVWVDLPDLAFVRHTSRIFGDAPLMPDQRMDFLRDNAINILGNFRSSALMFHYYGDAVWISGLPDEPAVDPLTTAFLLLGLAAWLVMMLKSRDPITILLPVLLFLMLLTPAFALWNPMETPNFMRSNGAQPAVYIVAALPLAIFCRDITRTLPRRWGLLIAVAVALCTILYATHYNSDMYFGRYTEHYLKAANPHIQAGKVLRGFAESDGNYGNAFVISSPHWWDTRAVGMEAGKPTFFNAPFASEVPLFLRRALERSDDLRLDPDRDLLFFFAQGNHDAPILLSEWFPQGRLVFHKLYIDSKSFYTYRVPALGSGAMRDFLAANA